MRNPTALDAMARWLVMTFAGVGLFALIPGTSFAAPGFASTRWLLALHPVQLLAVTMMLLAYVLFVVHVLQLAGGWCRDGLSLLLAGAAVLSVGGCVATFVWGTTALVVIAFVVAVCLHAGLSVRIDAMGHPRLSAAVPSATV